MKTKITKDSSIQDVLMAVKRNEVDVTKAEELLFQVLYEAHRLDRLANARFYKDKVDKIFDQEITIYEQLTKK